MGCHRQGPPHRRGHAVIKGLALIVMVLPATAVRVGAVLLNRNQTPLSTSGRYIVDNQGERVKWACVNWYGAYTSTFAAGGLEVRPLHAIVNRIVDLGFNCVRWMYSLQGYVQNPVVPDQFLAANPDLQGKTFLEMFDLTVQAMTDAGLMVIINNHVSKAGWCCNYGQDEGLWYVPGYNESVWIESLVFFARRYRANTLVVAYDLRNELHDYKETHLTWGDGNPLTDWAAAATRSGNAVLQAHPDVLIVVMAMGFGMDLRWMKNQPIQLIYPNKVVYEAHNYLEYQVFDNLAKLVAPWPVIRQWALLLLVLLLLVLLLILWTWCSAGTPRPPPGSVATTCGGWMVFYMLIAAVASWEVYNFGTKFCKLAAYADVLPWFIGSVTLGVASVFMALLGIWWMMQQLLVEARDKSDVNLKSVQPSVDGQAKSMHSPSDGTTGSTGTTGENTSMEVHASHRDPTQPRSSRRKRCCAPGCRSCLQAWRVMRRSLARWGRACVYWQFTAQKEMEPPAHWDDGMCCLLQLLVVGTIFLMVLIVLYVFANIFPTYWWMERHLDGLWGFALEEGFPYTAPVWMGEFGTEVRGEYWLNFMRYLAIRDVDFGYWALNGMKWSEGNIDGSSGEFVPYATPRWDDEPFGILDHTYQRVQYPWLVLDLQGLQPSPASWRPDAAPCGPHVSAGCLSR